jgi:hypothetical protein
MQAIFSLFIGANVLSASERLARMLNGTAMALVLSALLRD